MRDMQALKRLGGLGILTDDDLVDFDKQRGRVYWLMSDYKWHTGIEIINIADGTEGLRRLRELRATPGITIEKRRKAGGTRRNRTFEYRMKVET